MIVGESYEVSEDSNHIRLFGLQGSKQTEGTWRIEKWERANNTEPATSFVFEVKPLSTYARIEQLFDEHADAIAHGLGCLVITNRIGVRLFLEGYLTPAHFEKASTGELGMFIAIEVVIKGQRCRVMIFDERADIGAEVNFLQYTVEE